MAELVFLGTGGGRHVLISQERATAGFRIAGSRTVHVDPGPGYLQQCAKLALDPAAPDVLLISHCHIDHGNDANVAIEAMTGCGRRRRGAVFGENDSLFGAKEADRVISRYHQKMVARYRSLATGTSAAFLGVRVTATPAHHYGNCIGFIVELDGARTGYSSDTVYFAGMEKAFEGCDALVMNTIRPRGSSIPWHFGTDAAVKLLSALKRPPRLAVLQHFGRDMLSAGPKKEAAYVQRETGVKTVAATDGIRIGVP